MTRDDTARPPVFDAATLNAIATALGDDVLSPYRPPARPFTVGTRERYGIRHEYRAQTPTEPGAAHTPRGVQRVAEHVARALGRSPVLDLSMLVSDPLHPDSSTITSATARDAVVVCADMLQRSLAPDALLQYLVDLLDHAAVAIIAVPLRAIAITADDLGPPRNAAHAREWTFPELQAGLDAWGLEPLFGGVLPTTSDNPSQLDAPPIIGVIIVSTRTDTARASARFARETAR
jgi:hypothetical protein